MSNIGLTEAECEEIRKEREAAVTGLSKYLRQYLHNDGSGLVIAYDKSIEELFQKPRDAGVYSVRSISELHSMVYQLSQEGYRIVTVLDTQNGMYHVVGQKL